MKTLKDLYIKAKILLTPRSRLEECGKYEAGDYFRDVVPQTTQAAIHRKTF
jgi:hypothetical protein